MEIIQKIKNIGEFNNWRGFVGLYLTTKELMSLKKYGITKDTTIKLAFVYLTENCKKVTPNLTSGATNKKYNDNYFTNVR